ncbi:MAG: heparinase II/III-family protein, partial [Actinomycetota bacterium]|nr:heparinase II/III-family protein [Actinomycetota bacterium]
NRELASEYHCFVAELGLVAAVEAQSCGRPLSRGTWRHLVSMVDAAAAVVDENLRGPRQGDGDQGQALLVDRPAGDPWAPLLAVGANVFGRLPWWPPIPEGGVGATVITALAGCPTVAVQAGRPQERPADFADAGVTILRSPPSGRPEIWCRCDGGPHGYLSIAAHAHADALAIEVRVAGVDILSDPGTYCYHGEPTWRAYFRSTIGHNTLELAGRDQSESGGPFLWLSQAATTVLEVTVGDSARPEQLWSAEHDGYQTLVPPARHRRTVQMNGHRLEIVDHVDCCGRHPCRLAFHLGPSVEATLDGRFAGLRWPGAPEPASAKLELPPELCWSAHRGETDPVLGWYSAAFGRKQPTVTLIGSGTCGLGADTLRTVLYLPD